VSARQDWHSSRKGWNCQTAATDEPESCQPSQRSAAEREALDARGDGLTEERLQQCANGAPLSRMFLLRESVAGPPQCVRRSWENLPVRIERYPPKLRNCHACIASSCGALAKPGDQLTRVASNLFGLGAPILRMFLFQSGSMLLRLSGSVVVVQVLPFRVPAPWAGSRLKGRRQTRFILRVLP
jgi:hypothetical protein